MKHNTQELQEKIDAAILGAPLDALIPVLAGYLANCGVHGGVPRDILKAYLCEVVDDVYAAFTAPTDKEKIQ